jgi:transcriptional regulator with XRE-family HTH domain
VSGLRREEVAELANISSDYYVRIEQGRLAPSAPVLAALTTVLQLDEDQTDYVTSLLDHAAHVVTTSAITPSGSRRRTTPGKPRPQVQRLLDQLTDIPAFVLGPRMDILGWNALAEKVYVTFGDLPRKELNYVRLVFTNQRFRDLYEDWESVARSCVAILRREAVAKPDDPALAALVGELTIADREFGRMWASRNVARQDFGTKVLSHPTEGKLVLDWDLFRYGSAPEQQLVVNSAADGTDTHEKLQRLRGR